MDILLLIITNVIFTLLIQLTGGDNKGVAGGVRFSDPDIIPQNGEGIFICI